jgi:hypothetical protein
MTANAACLRDRRNTQAETAKFTNTPMAKVPICDAAPVKLLDATPTQSKHGENWMSRTNDRVRRLRIKE